MTLPKMFAARSLPAGVTWPYTSPVIAIEACPNISDTRLIGSPASNIIVAADYFINCAKPVSEAVSILIKVGYNKH
jgi:hypothetical protein